MKANNSNADNKPQVGVANTDIASFANTNTIGRYTGEPVGEFNLGRAVDTETQSGLVLGRPYTKISDEATEEALNTRFKTIDLEDHHKRGYNTIGGQLGDVISMNSDRFEKPESASEVGSHRGRPSESRTSEAPSYLAGAGRSNIDNPQRPSTDTSLNESRNTFDTTDRPPLSYPVYPGYIERRTGNRVNVGGNDENRRTGNWDSDLSSQLVGGPRPDTKLSGASGRRDVPYDITNQMYYAESTGNVKSTMKLGVSKDGGQAPLEGYDTTNEAIMKGIVTETEEYARQWAPKEPINTKNAGTTWAT